MENIVENRETLVKVMYEQAFEEDKKFAYTRHHMESLVEFTDEEFTAQWLEYKLPDVPKPTGCTCGSGTLDPMLHNSSCSQSWFY